MGRSSYEQLAALVFEQAAVIEELRVEVAEFKAAGRGPTRVQQECLTSLAKRDKGEPAAVEPCRSPRVWIDDG